MPTNRASREGFPAQSLYKNAMSSSWPPFPRIKPKVEVACKYPKHLRAVTQRIARDEEKYAVKQLTVNAISGRIHTMIEIRAPTHSL